MKLYFYKCYMRYLPLHCPVYQLVATSGEWITVELSFCITLLMSIARARVCVCSVNCYITEEFTLKVSRLKKNTKHIFPFCVN